MRKIFYTLVLLTSFSSLSAQTLLGENFIYTVGDTLANFALSNGWAAFSGGTTNAILVNSSSLSFPGHVGSSVGNSVFLRSTGQDCYKTLSLSVSSGSIYASALVNVDTTQATGDYPIALLPDNSTSLFTSRTFFRRSSANHYRVAISKSSTAPTIYSTDSFAYGTTYLLVIKYTFNSGTTTDDSTSLYYLSSLPLTEPITPTYGPVGGTQTDVLNLGRFALRQGSSANAPRLLVDAIRVSTSWSNAPLPVVLNSLKINSVNNSNQLMWSTASEHNNSGFEIQRSQDGHLFETIGFIKGAGNSNAINNYSYVDNEIDAITTYCYRLKQLDFDGTSDYSKTICVAARKLEAGSGSTTQPNPFNTELTVVLNSALEGNATVELVDMLGKVIAVKSVNTEKNNSSVQFDTNHINNGIYFVRINQNGSITTSKVVKR